jgi:nucleotide-binding universal stress UspA family protein
VEYKRILIGTDGGELMGPVYDHCAYMALLADATIHAVYVLDTWFTKYPDTRGMESMRYNLLSKGKEIIADAKKELTGRGVKGERVFTKLLEGSPAERLVEYAESHGIDLIMMGAHARQGLNRLIIGSVTDKIIREAKVPVVIVRNP